MTINKFEGEFRFLSNFFPAETMFEGVLYPTSEHAYQAAKFHPDMREEFKRGSPGNAKRMGRRPGIRSDWEQVKFDTMLTIVRDKFHRNRRLAEELVATGTQQLIEGNTWGDTTWGVCKGVGHNWLGRILMTVRQEIMEAM